MQIDGSCHCGAITFRAEADADTAGGCHCPDCQKLAGSAFRSVVSVAEKNFELLSGAPKICVKTADSGNRRVQAFCENCGLAVYAPSTGEVDRTFGLRLGTVTRRDRFVARHQYWARSVLHWLPRLNEIEKVGGNTRPQRGQAHG